MLKVKETGEVEPYQKNEFVNIDEKLKRSVKLQKLEIMKQKKRFFYLNE